MAYLFYGEDTYRSQEKILLLIAKYRKSNPESFNLIRIYSQEADYDEIIRQIFATPFFSGKRLIIIEDFLVSVSESLQQKMSLSLSKIPESSIVVFWEKGPIKNQSELFLQLNKSKNVQKFNYLTQPELIRWIEKFLSDKGAKGTLPAINLLSRFVGNDLWQMSNELNKLIYYVNGRAIEPDDVRFMVVPNEEYNQFAFLDRLFAPEINNTSLQELKKTDLSGTPVILTLKIINTTLIKVIIAKSWIENAMPKSEIAKKLKLSPYAANITYARAQKFSWDKLRHWQNIVCDIDEGIKSGRINEESAYLYLFCRFH